MLADFISSDMFLSAMAALVAAVWSTERGSRLFGWLQRRRQSTALLILEVAIMETYEQYVRDLKASSVDGKLHNGDRQLARDAAIDRAKILAARHGVDMDQVLGADYMRAWIERTLKKIRSK